jgi:hypothetical protein
LLSFTMTKMERWVRHVYPDSLEARVVSTLPV